MTPRDTITLKIDDRDLSFSLPSGSYGHGYEPEVVYALGKFLQPGDTAIDAGASCGYHSLIMSRLVGETGTVHAIEPNPAAFASLQDNLANNRAGNVRTHQLALLHDNQWRDFWPIDGNLAGNSSLLHFVQAGEPVRVFACSLDWLLALKAEGGKVRVLKIDCEGAEFPILLGAGGLLARGVDCVILELNFEIMSQSGISDTDIRAHMHGLGYDFFILEENGSYPLCVPPRAKLALTSGQHFHFNVMFARPEAVARAWQNGVYPLRYHRAEAA